MAQHNSEHTGSGVHAAHHHHSTAVISEKNLLAAVVLNFTISIAEVVGGILSNSLALLSDALHNLGDGLAVLLAYIAHRVSKRESNERKTFGYKRVEILAAFINSIILVAICIFLIYEAVERFRNPAPIKGAIMFSVAVVGLLANLVAMILLRNDSQKNINIRAAYLHLIGDTLSSVVVIAGGILSTAGLLFLSKHGFALDPPLDYGGTVFREMIASITPEC